MWIHYFPPYPDKIGDNLLTFEIAADLARAGWQGATLRVKYYASAVVIGVLGSFETPDIEFEPVTGVYDAARKAHGLRGEGAIVVDLQALNCWFDYPELQPLFGSPPTERVRLDWFHPEAMKRWPLESFPDLFRSMLEIPRSGSTLTPRSGLAAPRLDRGGSGPVLLFPHCATEIQQLSGWDRIASSLSRCLARPVDLAVIGEATAASLFAWPTRVQVLTDLEGGLLSETISQAVACVGGATGLTHLAGALHVPTFGLWRVDDLAVFAPRPGWSVRTRLCETVDEVVIQECVEFVSEACDGKQG